MTRQLSALLSPLGQELLAQLADETVRPETELALQRRLRRDFPEDLVAEALTQQRLRRAAAAKFSRAAEMFFTPSGLEQASAEMVARHRAARYTGLGLVADLCCGIGGDLIALAPGREVLAVDQDETHLEMALHNARVYGAGAGQVRGWHGDVRAAPLSVAGSGPVPGTRPAGADPGGARSGGGGSGGARSGGARSGGARCGGARSGGARSGGARSGGARSGGARSGVDAVFIDPARRAAGRRLRPGQSEPPLPWCTALAGQVPAVGIKAAPGLPAEAIPAGWEAEFIAVGRELKEAVLWSPALAGTSRRATVLPGGHTMARADPPPPGQQGAGPLQAGQPDAGPFQAGPAHPGRLPAGPQVPVREPGGYLLDPNPAVTRAGLVEDLAESVGAWKIDPRIAFLSADRALRTPFARTLRIAESAPWNEREFARRLRALGVGAADIRRRGLAGDVDAIHRRLKLDGPNRATVIITRMNGRPWGMICTDTPR